MNNISEQRSLYEREISVVDLAIILIRRRRLFCVVFLAFTLGGVAYAMLQTETYQYTSLLQVAEKSPANFLEEPSTTIATLENRWLPEQQTAFRTENNRKMPFNVSFSTPEGTGLIRFLSEAPSELDEEVEQVHSNLIENVKERQNATLDREKRSLLSRISSIDRSIETLQGGEDTGSAIAEAFDRKVGLESDLDALNPPEVLVVSRQSAGNTAPAKSLIIILAAVMGAIMGVVTVFCAQFAALIKSKLKEELIE